MRLVLGLGNPGKEYESTRHNSGFDTVDMLAAFFQVKLKERCSFTLTSALVDAVDPPVELIKPLTYMNRSGDILAHFPLVKAEDLIVICDQMDLPLGMIRIRKKGGDAGHNGLKSIISNLDGERGFIRIYVGIGRPAEGVSVPDHVLGKDPDQETRQIGIEKAKNAVIDILKGMKIEDAMQKYNATVPINCD